MDWKSATRLLRLQSNSTAADDNEITNIKLSKKLQEYFSQPLDSSSVKTFQETKDEQDLQTLHSFLAELFAGVAAVKSAYAELQLAQTPYSVDSIHAADRSLVSELKYLSSLKRSFLKDPFSPPSTSYQQSQLRELKELVKTFKINISRLESELHSKDAQLDSLRSHLDQIEAKNRSLQSPQQLSMKATNHHRHGLSGLNPTHFLPELRLTVKSIRSFARTMMKSMADSSKLDLNSAARAMYPNIVPNTKNLIFFFQSFVSHKMFSDFHRPDFNLAFLESRNREDFFREFQDSKLLSSGQFLNRWGSFVKAKFSATVHPKIIDSGSGSDLFPRFVEMARWVWILHCLFFSFGGSEEFSGSIFRVRSGCRFSEVYMESVADLDADPDPYSTPTVGFTVVPGFLLGSTVIQCKVYLSSSSSSS